MDGLGLSDYARILTTIGRIAKSETPEALADRIVRDAAELIPTHACGWIEIHAETGFSYGTMNVPVDPVAVAREMADVIHAHPVFKAFQRTGDGRARAISDLVARRDYRASALYCRFLKKYRSEDQLIIAADFDANRLVVLTLNRDSWGFSEREKAILNALRDPLFHTHRRLRQLAEAALAHDGVALTQQARPVLIEALAAKGLNRREAETAALMAEGASNREIAAALTVCEGTVRKHVDRVFYKLGVRNRAAATRAALGLLQRAESARHPSQPQPQPIARLDQGRHARPAEAVSFARSRRTSARTQGTGRSTDDDTGRAEEER